MCLCGNNQINMKSHFQIDKKRRGKFLLWRSLFIFFMLLLFCPNKSFASTDSLVGDTTVKYDLNDPRNPNCPCHDAQKKADEEYRKLQEQQAKEQANQNGNTQTNNNPTNNNPDNSNGGNSSDSTIATNANAVTSGSGGSSKHYSEKLLEWKSVHRWMRKMKKSLVKKGNGTRRGKRRLVDCFHF